MNRRDRFSRRAFLAATGLSAAFVPLLAPRSGRAAAAGPRRLLVVGKPNGTIKNVFWPQGQGDDLNLLTFPEIIEPLEKHKGELLFLGGLAYQNFLDSYDHDAHNAFPHTLTGSIGVRWPQDPNTINPQPTGGSESLDVYLANAINATSPLAFPLLTLGVRATGGGNNNQLSWMSFRGPNQPNNPEESPYRLFDQMFKGRDLGDAELERIRAERKSVLDYVGRSIEGFGQRLGTEDRLKIEAHAQAIRELEQRLNSDRNGCVAPAVGEPLDVDQYASVPGVWTAMTDLVVAAMACDLNRVTTINFTGGGGSTVMAWLGGEFTQPSPSGDFGGIHNHHEMTHHHSEDDIRPLKIRAEQWFMEQYSALIDRFKAIPEGDGTMLDNSVILFLDNMDNGAAHSLDKIPFFLAGSCGGYIKTGRYLKYGEWPARGYDGKCIPHNGLLVGLANAMGVPTESFGDPRYPAGELAGLQG